MIVLQRVLLSLVAFPFLITCCAVARAEPRCAENVATVVSAQGNVDIRGNATQEWQPVKVDSGICAGDSVTVRRFSRAVLRLEQEQTNIQLGEGTTLTLPGTKEQEFSIVELLKGITHFISRVPHALKIKTPFVNAAVEGTEFIVKVGDDQTLVSVSEGHVLADNADGQLILQSGQSALTKSGAAPSAHTIADPMETVQWALYYPHVSEFEPQSITNFGLEPWRAVIADSVRALRANDLRTALTLLEQAGEGITSTQYLLYRAHLLLTVGRVTEARADIEQVLVTDPNSSVAWVMRSIIAVTQGRAQLALESAQKAVQADEKSAPAYLALSYAHQAKFNLDSALTAALTATQVNENSALAWARVAELQLMHGYLTKALLAAQRAARINPNSAQAQTVLGFASLTELEIKFAATAFDGAVHLDPAAPLPRLGLGLVKIRQGDLAGGRAQLEIATSLDPRNSLLRSYMGKAYNEEKRGKLAGEQFAQAKMLDPKDPTPWFYDAILKQAQNRPVEALRDIQKSIELNDNRAVYRSRLLLDDDLAARGASQARVYQALGFEQAALNAAYQSVDLDPGNFSAHRFLADAYATRPRSEIARVSELLQAQLLQPLGLNPIQPQLQEQSLPSEGNAALLDFGLNEYSSLFLRQGVSAHANFIHGSDATWGDDVTASVIGTRASLSAGHYRYRSDGFRANADTEHSIYNVLGQWRVTPTFNTQLELRRRESGLGDVVMNFDPADHNAQNRQDTTRESARAGLHWQASTHTDVLISLTKARLDRATKNYSSNGPIADDKTQEDGYQSEARLIRRFDASNLTFGFRSFKTHIDHTRHYDWTPVFDVACPPSPPFPPVPCEISSPGTAQQRSIYVYDNFQLPYQVFATLGVSYDDLKFSGAHLKKTNPKLGLQWQVLPGLHARAGLLRVTKSRALLEQTLEPTQVAGFNQFYDDYNGARIRQHGVGVDAQPRADLRLGIERLTRAVEIPRIDNQNGIALISYAQRNEHVLNSYVYWVIDNTWQLRLAHNRERVTNDASGPVRVDTDQMPMTLSFQAADMLNVSLTARWLHQRVDLGPGSTFNRSSEAVWLLDAGVVYKLPRRYGEVSLSVHNLANRDFLYQDSNYRTANLISPDFVPARKVLLKVAVNL